MNFDWKTYVSLAEELLQQDRESHLRSSISRAYFGVFCIARNRKGYQNYRGSVHDEVITAYRTSADKTERHIGQLLDGLRFERNGADYKESKNISRGLAEKQVQSAKLVLKKMGIL
jgi:uncharacterized protein (UPF0332 family)